MLVPSFNQCSTSTHYSWLTATSPMMLLKVHSSVFAVDNFQLHCALALMKLTGCIVFGLKQRNVMSEMLSDVKPLVWWGQCCCGEHLHFSNEQSPILIPNSQSLSARNLHVCQLKS